MDYELGDIAIIGAGKVGTALAVLAARAGLRVAAMGGRDPARTAAAAAGVSSTTAATGVVQAARTGRIVLLCVSDEAIAPVLDELVRASALPAGGVVAHCSGALGSEVLAPARRLGCAVGSFHPLATFPTVQRAVEKLGGSYCFIEGDAPAAEALAQLARRIGAVPVAMSSQAKPLYHAAAVMACNYQAALVDAALELMHQAGIEAPLALRALGPLVQSTVDNVTSLGPAAALTGPIARGDGATVAAHLRAMEKLPQLAALYRQAGLWTVRLARRKGTLDPQRAQELEALLREQPSPMD